MKLTDAVAMKIANKIIKRESAKGFASWAIMPSVLVREAIIEWEIMNDRPGGDQP